MIADALRVGNLCAPPGRGTSVYGKQLRMVEGPVLADFCLSVLSIAAVPVEIAEIDTGGLANARQREGLSRGGQPRLTAIWRHTFGAQHHIAGKTSRRCIAGKEFESIGTWASSRQYELCDRRPSRSLVAGVAIYFCLAIHSSTRASSIGNGSVPSPITTS
jgi:hypothetical protein